MIEKAYQKIIGVLTPIMEEKGFTEDKENNCFIVAHERAIKVEYNEKIKAYELLSCNCTDEAPDKDWKILTSWLFDEESDEKDISSICNDFEDTLKETLKLKVVKARFIEKGNASTASGTEAFTQKFLALYPEYKPVYAEMLEKYGVFLSEEFFVTCGREKLIELMNAGAKKPIEKMAKFLSDFYEESDPEVRSIITSTILTGLIKYDGKEQSFEFLFGGMSELTVRNTKATLKLYKNSK